MQAVSITLAVIYYFIFLIVGSLPFFLIYAVSDFLAFFLRRIIKYRLEVVTRNIRESFPGMTELEQDQIIKASFKNLADIFLEGIKAFAITRRQVNTRHRIMNPEMIAQYFKEKKSIIIVTGHYCNWEWGAFSASLQTPYKTIGFYKPVGNKRLDRLVRKNRSRFGTLLSLIYETTKTFEENLGRPVIYLMAADQSPSNREKSYWVNFLGRDTAFLHGPEKHARLNNYPVLYVDIRRGKRGYYELWLSVISDDPSKLPEGEITQRFAAKLESVIRHDPANWLWSHKRWKLTR